MSDHAQPLLPDTMFVLVEQDGGSAHVRAAAYSIDAALAHLRKIYTDEYPPPSSSSFRIERAPLAERATTPP